MEVIRWFCPYCLEYYLIAYIVQHKLTMKHKKNKKEFEKRYYEKERCVSNVIAIIHTNSLIIEFS